jgi:hypothetical protein
MQGVRDKVRQLRNALAAAAKHEHRRGNESLDRHDDRTELHRARRSHDLGSAFADPLDLQSRCRNCRWCGENLTVW